MKIGIDISLLQTAHRRRGIGYTLINFVNHLPKEAKQDHTFVLYHYPINDDDPFDLLDLRGVTYEAREIIPTKLYDTGGRGRFGLLLGMINHIKTFKDILFGDSRIKDIDDLGYFLQFDQNHLLPPRRKVPSAQILYDIIPYVMKHDYMWTYGIARAKGRSRKNSLKQHVRRRLYYWRTRMIARKAQKLLAISEHTKNDFIKYMKVRPKKISVCHLGVEESPVAVPKNPALDRYVETSWGPLPQKTTLPKGKFLLFVGGGDQRRKLVDLLAAFNKLRAQGEDVKLALAGDTMRGPNTTPIEELNRYFKSTSYMDDIYFLGFVTDKQREWLYENALAFVYPSVYEGFGLPVIEAMLRGTPVITYKNTSIEEVAGSAALYAHNSDTILEQTQKLLTDSKLRGKYKNLGKKQASKFSWNETSRCIVKKLLN
ncbi:MAG: glycosyltransferase family 1 protein [Candidatus Saccharibacteria bacterium]|nr:glycosyltransferase family 1 protein [Candidatus Saccharibacteria bacterium]